jgi:hypothetical protein
VRQLVERILPAKQWDAGADVGALERELDELVYAGYRLRRGFGRQAARRRRRSKSWSQRRQDVAQRPPGRG